MNVFLTLSFVVLSSLGVASCAKQSEGERCDQEYGGDNDCEGNLICVSAQYLKGEADRCCPAEGESYGDKRCKRFIDTGSDTTVGTGGTDGTDGTGATAGASGNAGTAGASSAGAAGRVEIPTVGCRYTSDCEAPFVCGPTGVCQPECATDRDCEAPRVCDTSTQTCVEPAA
jgi:hypothetical protein